MNQAFYKRQNRQLKKTIHELEAQIVKVKQEFEDFTKNPITPPKKKEPVKAPVTDKPKADKPKSKKGKK